MGIQRRGSANLEISEEQCELMPSAEQARDVSADWLHSWRRLLTSSQSPPGGVRQKWQFAVAKSSGVSRRRTREKKIHRTIELPTQMPIVSSILFFMAIHTDVTCSAAFAYRRQWVALSRSREGCTHDDGKKNETDERLWNVISSCCLLDRSHH